MDFKQNLCAAISNACGMTAEQIGDMLETPPNPAMGDFALPCFKLAKTFRKAPPAIAAELARNLGEIEGFASLSYAELAKKEANVLFGGRLGQYKYYDMDKVIRSALDMVKEELAR